MVNRLRKGGYDSETAPQCEGGTRVHAKAGTPSRRKLNLLSLLVGMMGIGTAGSRYAEKEGPP